jgi:hypothetical protein
MTPLLTLLLDDPATIGAARMIAAVEEAAEIDFAHKAQPGGAGFDLLFRGLVVSLHFAEPGGDLGAAKSIFHEADPHLAASVVHFRFSSLVSGGERVPVILKALLELAAMVGERCGATAVLWHPANLLNGFDYFCARVRQYAGGGAFPVLALVDFVVNEDGGVDSRGLAALCGQEISALPARETDEEQLKRRAVRVAHDLAVNGPIRSETVLPDAEAGEKLMLQPVPSGAIVNVQTASI